MQVADRWHIVHNLTAALDGRRSLAWLTAEYDRLQNQLTRNLASHF
jgi:hypothetical protein